MNLWNVAFIRDILGNIHFVFPFEEPVEDRTYTCLVKWKEPSLELGRRVEIAEVQFDRYASEKSADRVKLVRRGDEGEPKLLPIANKIEFAIFGQQVIKNGSFLDYANTILQFSDLRHIFQLSNVNPNQPLSELRGDVGRPRTIFNRTQFDDVWLGEYALLNDRNLRRAALAGPVQLSIAELGTTEEHIEASFLGAKYEEQKNSLAKLDPGQWRKIREGRDTWYEIYFRRNVYPCSILGIDKSGDLISFAWRGRYEPPGMKIEEAAIFLTGSGLSVTDALLIDEGGDVYQYVDGTDIQLPPTRSQVRAMFIFTAKK